MQSRHIPVILFMTSLLTVAAHAGIPQFFTSQKQDWNFIQSVGGMTVHLEGNTLKVDCDVSGLKTVTVKPSMINSGMGVRKLKQKRDGNTIDLTLVTCVIGKGVQTSPVPLDISTYPNGAYAVRYRDPDGSTHPIRKIVIKQEKDLPPPDRVILEEARILLWFSRQVSERIRPEQTVWLITQFIKQHSECRARMIKAYPELYKLGTPSIVCQTDPTIESILSSSSELFLIKLEELRALIAKRDNEKEGEALELLDNWFETGRSMKDQEEAARPDVENPNIQITIRTVQGVDNINIKRGRKSFLNHGVGTPNHRVEAVKVSDDTYVQLRDLCLDAFRNPPPSVDGAYQINITLPLFGPEIEHHGLTTNRCTFSYDSGQSDSVDKLLKLTTDLLNIHRTE